MRITTVGVGAAVAPAVVATGFSHYTNRKPRRQKPTAHISYDEGLHLIKSFLIYASHHTVEEVQAFTSQWVPHPRWIRTEDVQIPHDQIARAAEVLTAQLGPDGVKKVGGTQWWQWRKKEDDLKAEWIEMRSDYNARVKSKEKCRRVMLYVHGGAYFFGSVDEHRYQMQRHARKLKARVFAPRYRLAPQFPFPCGLHDCMAAYLYLLQMHDPTEIILAGDSAGGGMVMSMLVTIRDQELPMPAGAVLLSPWVDLTHSFPSLGRTDELDYIPPCGFMQKPSRDWPPPNIDDVKDIKARKRPEIKQNTSAMTVAGADQNVARLDAALVPDDELQPLTKTLSVHINGKEMAIKDQIQLYTTNQLITHPLVSQVLQPSLGGLPPLLIMVGGGELLRDEQVYLAHKAANPQAYKLSPRWQKEYDPNDKILNKYKPTPVQLQIWDDMCHVTPTLSFTRPAKYMYRSVAQFGAWALARAQHRGIEIVDDDDISIISTSTSSSRTRHGNEQQKAESSANGHAHKEQRHGDLLQSVGSVGKAGDPLPAFHSNMIRQRVDRHGNTYDLGPSADLAGCAVPPDEIGLVKEGPVKKWLAASSQWNDQYASTKRKITKQRVKYYKPDHELGFGAGENPPPSALIRRRHEKGASLPRRIRKSWGLGMWSSWSWKHDERTMAKEEEVARMEEQEEHKEIPIIASDGTAEGDAAAEREEKKEQAQRLRSGSRPKTLTSRSRGRSVKSNDSTPARARRRTISVQDQGQTEGPTNTVADVAPAVASPISLDTPSAATQIPSPASQPSEEQTLLTTGFIPKWRQPSSHLKSDSVNTTGIDAQSTYSVNTIPDNASTRAVFSAPGISSMTPSNPLATTTKSSIQTDPDRPNTSNTENGSALVRPSEDLLRDHVGGYDTPTSRLSIERLQRHQTADFSLDTASIATGKHSDLSAPQTGIEVPTNGSSTLPGDIGSNARRNLSNVAIVQAPGIINPTDSGKTADPESNQKDEEEKGKEKVHEAADPDLDEQTTPKAEHVTNPIDGVVPSTEAQTGERPGMYSRSDSEFVTAHSQVPLAEKSE